MSDPDHDAVTVHWWRWSDADTLPEGVPLDRSDGSATSLTVPASAKPGETIDVIAEATDDGATPLTRYARVILKVTSR